MIGETRSPDRLFPDINRPGYEHAGRLSGFGWPNLLAFWKCYTLSFTQPVVPFSVLLPMAGSVRAAVDRRYLEITNGTYLAVPPGSEVAIKELVAPDSGRTPELLIAFCNPTFVRNVWQSDEKRFHPIVRVYKADHVSEALRTALRGYLKAPGEAVDDDEIEDVLYGVIRTFAERDQEDRARWTDLSARDDAERVRLFSQLSRARDLVHAAFASSKPAVDSKRDFGILGRCASSVALEVSARSRGPSSVATAAHRETSQFSRSPSRLGMVF